MTGRKKEIINYEIMHGEDCVAEIDTRGTARIYRCPTTVFL